MRQEINKIADKLRDLSNSDFYSFDEVAALKNKMGVYIIHEEDRIIYIGKTNKFNIRFGTDLKHESTHTLVRKLIKSGQFDNRYQVVKYLRESCRVQIAFCESNRECEALEAIAIHILDPALNKR